MAKNTQAKHNLASDIYQGKVDSMATKEIAELYRISHSVCLKFLLQIISGKVSDPAYPFEFSESDEGVYIQDDRMFVKSDCGDFADGKTGAANHYRWFLS